MKEIKGRYADSSNRPASYGSLMLQLQSDKICDDPFSVEDINSLVPLPDGEEVKSSYRFTLDENGEIPPGAMILANDELTDDTWYNVIVSVNRPRPLNYYYQQNLKITGPGPIDLNAIIPEGAEPEPEPEPAPPVAPPLPSKRVPGANYSGFWGGVIYPAGQGDCMAIEQEQRYPFYLPFKAVVRQASIFVDVPHLGRPATVTVGLRDVTSGKTVSATIKASKQGIASAFFDEAAILNQGEHILSWSADSTALKVRSIVKAGFDRNVVIGPMVYFSA